jgi:hypothetical protein
MASLDDLIKDLKNQEDGLKRQLSEVHFEIGKEVFIDIKNNFNKQMYDSGEGSEIWGARSPIVNTIYDNHSKYKNSPYKSKKPLLKQTLSLFNGIEFKHRQSEVEIGIFAKRNSFSGARVDQYARFMNEGIKNYWKEVKIDITPRKRQFMPTPTEGINQKIIKIIEKVWMKAERKIFRKFSKI